MESTIQTIRKIIGTVSAILLVLLGFIFFYLAFINYQMNQEYIRSDKGHMLVTVHGDRNGEQIVRFPEINYGVSIDVSDHKEGDQVYIYYQKDKPYRNSFSPKYYRTMGDYLEMILIGIAIISFVFFMQFILPKIAKRFRIKHQLQSNI